MKARQIELDFHHVKISVIGVIRFVKEKQQEHPEREYFMDGDSYAIVSQERD